MVTRVNATVISIEGSVSSTVAAQFSAALDGDVRTLEIYSGGGEPESARAIGRLVHGRNLEVMVIGVCAADCAKYIFLSGAKRSIAPGSVVAFGNNYAGLSAIAQQDGDASVRALYAKEAQAEHDYYREMGLPDRLLYDFQEAMQGQCYTVFRNAAGKPTDLGVVTRYKIVAFPNAYFKALGLAVSGFWPSNVEEALAADNKLFRPGAPFARRLDDMITPPEKVLAQLRQIKQCTQPQLLAAGLL